MTFPGPGEAIQGRPGLLRQPGLGGAFGEGFQQLLGIRAAGVLQHFNCPEPAQTVRRSEDLGQLQERFDANIVNFMDQVEASKHYPCVKRAWVEYLGEQPDPVLDRVE